MKIPRIRRRDLNDFHEVKSSSKIPNFILLTGLGMLIIPGIFFDIGKDGILQLSGENSIPEIITVIGAVLTLFSAIIRTKKKENCPICSSELEKTLVLEPDGSKIIYKMCSLCKVYINTGVGDSSDYN